MLYPSYKFDGAKLLESGKSSFTFLHVHSHSDPVNYIHVLQQVVGLRYCQFSYGVSTKCIGYNYTICMEPIGFDCVTAPVHISISIINTGHELNSTATLDLPLIQVEKLSIIIAY